jgi:hypothetical protein
VRAAGGPRARFTSFTDSIFWLWLQEFDHDCGSLAGSLALPPKTQSEARGSANWCLHSSWSVAAERRRSTVEWECINSVGLELSILIVSPGLHGQAECLYQKYLLKAARRLRARGGRLLGRRREAPPLKCCYGQFDFQRACNCRRSGDSRAVPLRDNSFDLGCDSRTSPAMTPQPRLALSSGER